MIWAVIQYYTVTNLRYKCVTIARKENMLPLSINTQPLYPTLLRQLERFGVLLILQLGALLVRPGYVRLCEN